MTGCPDVDANGNYSAQSHKMVNGFARYMKDHSFYYLYRSRAGHWQVTWFEPDIDEDKGDFRSDTPVRTPDRATLWVGGLTGEPYEAMRVALR